MKNNELTYWFGVVVSYIFTLISLVKIMTLEQGIFGTGAFVIAALAVWALYGNKRHI